MLIKFEGKHQEICDCAGNPTSGCAHAFSFNSWVLQYSMMCKHMNRWQPWYINDNFHNINRKWEVSLIVLLLKQKNVGVKPEHLLINKKQNMS